MACTPTLIQPAFSSTGLNYRHIDGIRAGGIMADKVCKIHTSTVIRMWSSFKFQVSQQHDLDGYLTSGGGGHHVTSPRQHVTKATWCLGWYTGTSRSKKWNNITSDHNTFNVLIQGDCVERFKKVITYQSCNYSVLVNKLIALLKVALHCYTHYPGPRLSVWIRLMLKITMYTYIQHIV